MADTLTVSDIRLGAIYRIGRRLDKPAVSRLLHERAGMRPEKADQLVAHWFTTEPYRSTPARSGEPR